MPWNEMGTFPGDTDPLPPVQNTICLSEVVIVKGDLLGLVGKYLRMVFLPLTSMLSYNFQ